jgi:hypothetical protein
LVIFFPFFPLPQAGLGSRAYTDLPTTTDPAEMEYILSELFRLRRDARNGVNLNQRRKITLCRLNHVPAKRAFCSMAISFFANESEKTLAVRDLWKKEHNLPHLSCDLFRQKLFSFITGCFSTVSRDYIIRHHVDYLKLCRRVVVNYLPFWTTEGPMPSRLKMYGAMRHRVRSNLLDLEQGQ